MTPTTLAGATTVAATQHKTKHKHSNFIFGKKLILFKIMTTDSQVISVSCGSLQGLLHTSKFGPGCRSICIEFKGIVSRTLAYIPKVRIDAIYEALVYVDIVAS